MDVGAMTPFLWTFEEREKIKGFYDDVCVRTAEGWRFARRSLVPRNLGRPEGLTGRVLPLDGLPAW